ncbi:MAG TPA: peptidyl-tRNA hydrolase Pth2 [Thermoplasmata archaeon]|nr:peptidyl-tRNA hydrolase Pth2 [Thermoplasmata archaeon]
MPSSRGRGGYKMVLVVRGELRLTCGKAAIQVAHAAVMLVDLARRRPAAATEAWVREGQKKIALVAPTLQAMQVLERLARAKGLPTVLVEDAGFTEVPPGTKTVLGIGPGRDEEIDPITGSLPLL